MSDEFIIFDRKHKACIQTSDGCNGVALFKIIGVKNQSEKEKYDYLQAKGREPEEGFYFKTRKVLEADDGGSVASGVANGVAKPKYEKKINYIFTKYV